MREPSEEIIVGIDLGTTNSLVAHIVNGVPICVRGADERSTLVPSVLHFAEDGSILVGDAAKEKLVSSPERTVFSVKRLMGKSYSDVADFQRYLGYKVIDDDTESLVKVRVGDRFYSPIELSGYILRELKERIEANLGRTVSKAVITVPAYFNDAQRQATRDAGKLAGLDVLRIVNEPTAASLAYGIDQKAAESEIIAVYDLGGGTFDVSILQIQGGIFEVLATSGDTFLGGDDFDRVIVDAWQTLGDAPPQALRLLAESAKKALSASTSFSAELNGQTYTLDRETFDKLIEPLVQRTLDCCQQAVNDAQLKIADIQHIVMVGGSTRVPRVVRAVSDFFDKAVNNSLDPDEVVAQGAAIQADILAGNQRDLLLLDVTPLSLGIETIGGLMDTIIGRNSKIPTKAGRQYTTSVDGQTNLKVGVYQGERDLVAHNRKLGEFTLRGIPPMPAGLPKIDIQFILNADGILTVRARELRSNVEQIVEIRSQYGLSEEEMALMLLDSIKNAKTDMAARSLLEARNEANNIVRSAERFLKQHEGLLSQSEIEATVSLTENLKKATISDDKDAIQRAMDDLNTYTAPLAHRALDITIASALKGKAIG